MTEKTGQPHYLEELYKELALALGDAVWAFARIEWLTYESLGRMSADKLDELVGDIGFRSRTAILRRIVNRKKGFAAKKQRALDAIKAVEDLADERNIIVHNPWRIWVDLDSEKFMTQIDKYGRPDKKLDIQQLLTFVILCHGAERELKEALNAL